MLLENKTDPPEFYISYNPCPKEAEVLGKIQARAVEDSAEKGESQACTELLKKAYNLGARGIYELKFESKIKGANIETVARAIAVEKPIHIRDDEKKTEKYTPSILTVLLLLLIGIGGMFYQIQRKNELIVNIDIRLSQSLESLANNRPEQAKKQFRQAFQDSGEFYAGLDTLKAMDQYNLLNIPDPKEVEDKFKTFKNIIAKPYIKRLETARKKIQKGLEPDKNILEGVAILNETPEELKNTEDFFNTFYKDEMQSISSQNNHLIINILNQKMNDIKIACMFGENMETEQGFYEISVFEQKLQQLEEGLKCPSLKNKVKIIARELPRLKADYLAERLQKMETRTDSNIILYNINRMGEESEYILTQLNEMEKTSSSDIMQKQIEEMKNKNLEVKINYLTSGIDKIEKNTKQTGDTSYYKEELAYISHELKKTYKITPSHTLKAQIKKLMDKTALLKLQKPHNKDKNKEIYMAKSDNQNSQYKNTKENIQKYPPSPPHPQKTPYSHKNPHQPPYPQATPYPTASPQKDYSSFQNSSYSSTEEKVNEKKYSKKESSEEQNKKEKNSDESSEKEKQEKKRKKEKKKSEWGTHPISQMGTPISEMGTPISEMGTPVSGVENRPGNQSKKSTKNQE